VEQVAWATVAPLRLTTPLFAVKLTSMRHTSFAEKAGGDGMLKHSLFGQHT
jgi:hypothetical protein